MYLSDKNKFYTIFAKKRERYYRFKNGIGEILIFIFKKMLSLTRCQYNAYKYYLLFTKTNTCSLKRMRNIIKRITQ